MKTQEELKELREEYKNLLEKLQELDEGELKEITAGSMPKIKEDERYVMSINPVKPVPIKPIVSKKCPNKPCIYSSKEQCPYYSDEIDDCDKN